MARQPAKPALVALSAETMRSALPRLAKRIDELQAFNPSEMKRRDDPVATGIQDRVNQTLTDIFGPETDEFRRFSVALNTAGYNAYSGTPKEEWVQGYVEGIEEAIEKLKSVIVMFEERLSESSSVAAPQRTAAETRKIFVVHGHDDGAKQEVARLLVQLELEPIILHEELNRGQTVIEKFERHASEARFAVVLLTPDDIGHAAGKPEEAQSRARQNVILELGFFAGKLGRQHVVALTKGVEMPSDLHGVLYEQMDDRGFWKVRVAKEIKAAGIHVDLNRL